jgi:hypothetical protein
LAITFFKNSSVGHNFLAASRDTVEVIATQGTMPSLLKPVSIILFIILENAIKKSLYNTFGCYLI